MNKLVFFIYFENRTFQNVKKLFSEIKNENKFNKQR